MNQAQVIISNNNVQIYALYYLSNNNYYLIYTLGEVDENDFVILNIAKILQEVINTDNGPKPTGYLVGTTISNEEEYNLVKQDIANIIDAKQNNLDNPVVYIDPSNFSQLKIRDTKVFRLKKFVFEQVFGKGIAVSKKPDDYDDAELEKKYKFEKNRNDELSAEIDNLNNIIVGLNQKNSELNSTIEKLNYRANVLNEKLERIKSALQ
jgi:cell division protein FtsB